MYGRGPGRRHCYGTCFFTIRFFNKDLAGGGGGGVISSIAVVA